jgi:hypothetical protein
MMELAIVGALAGVALGLRYKVLVLVPAVMLALTFSVMVRVAYADSFWLTTLTIAAVVTALQLGYLAGVVVRTIIERIFPWQSGERKSPADQSAAGQVREDTSVDDVSPLPESSTCDRRGHNTEAKQPNGKNLATSRPVQQRCRQLAGAREEARNKNHRPWTVKPGDGAAHRPWSRQRFRIR